MTNRRVILLRHRLSQIAIIQVWQVQVVMIVTVKIIAAYSKATLQTATTPAVVKTATQTAIIIVQNH